MEYDIDRIVRDSDKSRIVFEKQERTYLYHLPAGFDARRAYPLVVILHGGGANAENALRMADMQPLADREGFLLLFPDGSGRPGDRTYTWNSGHCCGYAREAQCRDSAFLSFLIDHFIRSHAADPARVYVAGFSNGAMMAHRLACDTAEKIAAIAAVSGALNYDGAKPSQKLAVLSIHGKKDTHAPYDGGQGADTRYPRKDKPVEDGVRQWAEWNGCAAPTYENGEAFLKIVYPGKTADEDVMHYALAEQGHAWPGGRPGLRYGNVDMPSQALHATELIWNFFKPRRKAGF